MNSSNQVNECGQQASVGRLDGLFVDIEAQAPSKFGACLQRITRRAFLLLTKLSKVLSRCAPG